VLNKRKYKLKVIIAGYVRYVTTVRGIIIKDDIIPSTHTTKGTIHSTYDTLTSNLISKQNPASPSSTTSAPFTMPPPPRSPMNQQPTRTLSTPSAPAIPYTPMHHSCTFATSRPRTQIEALPPGTLHSFNFDDFLHPDYSSLGPQRGLLPTPTAQPPQYDPATRHPVFFTNTLQKPPFGVRAGSSVSPVAMGYVENSISKGRDGGNVKL
jgi:hypothetical protein